MGTRERGRFPRSWSRTRSTSSAMSGSRGSTWRRRRRTCAPGCPRPARAGGGRRGWRRSPRPRGRSWRWPGGCSPTGCSWSVMESTSDYWRIWYYLLEGAGLTVQLVNPRARPAAGRAAEDRPARRAVDRPAGRDGPAAPVVRAAAGDPGAARPDPHPAAAGPRPHPGVAAAGETARRRPGQAVVGGVARWPGPRPPATSWRPSPTASATRRPWPPWRTRNVNGGRAARRARPWRACSSAITIPC